MLSPPIPTDPLAARSIAFTSESESLRNVTPACLRAGRRLAPRRTATYVGQRREFHAVMPVDRHSTHTHAHTHTHTHGIRTGYPAVLADFDGAARTLIAARYSRSAAGTICRISSWDRFHLDKSVRFASCHSTVPVIRLRPWNVSRRLVWLVVRILPLTATAPGGRTHFWPLFDSISTYTFKET